MHNDRIQGILFDKKETVDLRPRSGSEKLVDGFIEKVRQTRVWHQRFYKKAQITRHIAVHKGRSRNSEIESLIERLNIDS